MMRAELVGGAEVIARIDRLPARVRDELKVGIGRATLKLQRMVVEDKLNGQVLHVRTGRLRRSIGQVVEVDAERVSGIVSSPVKYAPYHEYGFSGTETVREHLRRSKAQFSLRKLTKKGRETAASKRRWDGKGEITVRAHERHVEYPPHSFLRSALADLKASGFIDAEINAALGRAVA